MTPDKEKLVIARAKKGEMLAFEEIVTAYEKRVFVLALRSCGNEEDARDISQEVFLKVYRSIQSFREESGLSTWIYKIATNICIDFSRKNSKHSKNTTNIDEDENVRQIQDLDTNNQPETAFENAVMRKEINDALAKLSSEHRNIIVLRDVSGLSYTEIATVIGASEGTVKSRISRARKNLQQILCKSGNFTGTGTSKQTERGR